MYVVVCNGAFLPPEWELFLPHYSLEHQRGGKTPRSTQSVTVFGSWTVGETGTTLAAVIQSITRFAI